MKNKITIIILGILILVGVGCFIIVKGKEKKEDPKSLLNEINTVVVDDELVNKKIEIDEITITDITLNKENKELYMKVSSKKKIEEVKLEVVLLNPEVENSANKKGLIIKELEEEKIIKFDLKEIYNNPIKIKFIIEK